MPNQTKKTDNSRLPEKLALRRYFLRRVFASATSAYVFDACQGSGVLWSALRKEFPVRYWGVDQKRKAGRLAINSVRVLEQPGWDFDVVDIDTYGSPWKHWLALLPRVRKRTTVFLTIGVVKIFGGGADTAVLKLAGLNFRTLKLPPSFGGKLADYLLDHVLAEPYRHGLRIEHLAEAEVLGRSNMRYIGVTLEPEKA